MTGRVELQRQRAKILKKKNSLINEVKYVLIHYEVKPGTAGVP